MVGFVQQSGNKWIYTNILPYRNFLWDHQVRPFRFWSDGSLSVTVESHELLAAWRVAGRSTAVWLSLVPPLFNDTETLTFVRRIHRIMQWE